MQTLFKNYFLSSKVRPLVKSSFYSKIFLKMSLRIPLHLSILWYLSPLAPTLRLIFGLSLRAASIQKLVFNFCFCGLYSITASLDWPLLARVWYNEHHTVILYNHHYSAVLWVRGIFFSSQKAVPDFITGFPLAFLVSM